MKVVFAAAFLAAFPSIHAHAEAGKLPPPACVPLEERVIYYQAEELVCRAVLSKSQVLAIIRIPQLDAQVFFLGDRATFSKGGVVQSSGPLKAKVSCSEGPFYVEWENSRYMDAYGRMLAHKSGEHSLECRYVPRLSQPP